MGTSTPGRTGRARPTRLGRGRAPRALTAAGALLATLLAPSPAGATPLPPCVPDGSVTVDVQAPDSAAAGTSVAVTARVVDSCGGTDTGYTGSFFLVAYGVGGGETPPVLLTLTAEDEGEGTVPVTLPWQGLTFLALLDETAEQAAGIGSVLVHGEPQRYPVVDDLTALGFAGSYRASGVTADPDAPGAAVAVSVRVDGREVARTLADDPSEAWGLAPASVGPDHGFDLVVPVPAGRHSVCLYVDDRAPGSSAVSPVNVQCQTVEGVPTSTPASTFGWYDGLYRTPSGVVAAGWAIDPTDPDGTAEVVVTTRYQSYDRGPWTAGPRPVTLSALRPREDVGAAYPAWGPSHGFVSGAYGGATLDRVEVCLRAGTSTELGCRSAVVQHDPVGSLDPVTPVPGGVAVRGWALDQDTYASVDVHVYVDGAPAGVLRADQARPDVAAAFPPSPGGLVPGYGAARGYEARLSAPAGRRTVCAYGIDADGSLPPWGVNALLGCRDVVVPDAGPVGRVDGATPVPGGFALRGWTADPDAPTTALQVHTYRDGVGAAITTADSTRPDLAGLEGGRYGTAHGFTTGTVATGATARVCSYAINVGPGSNTTLGCQDLSRSLTPAGAVDGAAREGLPGTVRVRGWALDPDTAAPVDVHVYVDGRLAGTTTASGPRPDLLAAYPGWGAGHGYGLDVTAAPGARVCTYAINTAQGSGNTTLGCRTA